MPITDEPRKPIRLRPLAGPAVEARKNRREDNNNAKAETDLLLAGYRGKRESIFRSLKELLDKRK